MAWQGAASREIPPWEVCARAPVRIIGGMRTVLALVLLACPGALLAQADSGPLFPAGSINAVFGHPRLLILAEDDPAVIRQATFVRDRFFKDRSELVIGKDALTKDLAGHNLLVYGTVDGHPWLARMRHRLPVAYGEGAVEIEGEHHGDRLRVICTIRNPADPERRAILYTAANARDLLDINGVFHGPTEYVVADGTKVLANGNYMARAPLQPAAMREDLEFLIGKVLSVHPATVEGPAAELAAAIDGARRAIAEPMSQQAFWLVANRIIASLHDAHSSMAPPRSARPLALPLDWLEDGLVATRDLDPLERGDRVVSIGGLDEAALLHGVRAVVPAENDHWLRAQGSVRLRDPAFLKLLGVEVGASVEVVVERNGEALAVEVGAASGPIDPPRPAHWVRWTLDADSGLAVIAIDRCVFDEYYERRVRRFFELVAEHGIGRIAIDLRENSGGNSRVCDEFLRYVAVDEYRTYSAAVRETEDSCAQRGYERELGFHRYGPQVKKNQPAEGIEPFAGKLLALTSKRTFSSGSWFAVILRDNDLGELVGEPTGGAPSGYGDILTFSMPNSSIGFSVSYKDWMRPAQAAGHEATLEPDHLVPLTRRDILRGTDPVLDWLRTR